jgi:hypothetical protein
MLDEVIKIVNCQVAASKFTAIFRFVPGNGI